MSTGNPQLDALCKQLAAEVQTSMKGDPAVQQHIESGSEMGDMVKKMQMQVLENMAGPKQPPMPEELQAIVNNLLQQPVLIGPTYKFVAKLLNYLNYQMQAALKDVLQGKVPEGWEPPVDDAIKS